MSFVLRTLNFDLHSLRPYLRLALQRQELNLLQLPTSQEQSTKLKVQSSFFLLPGFIAGIPCPQRSQKAGSTAGTSRVANATRVTPTSARPEERPRMEPAPLTSAPAAANVCTVSSVERTVVITSSTTSVRSPGITEKPRRSVIAPSTRSVQMNRAPSWRATS